MHVKIRKGCKDNWNAFMVKGATFTKNDIPYCPNTNTKIPTSIITYEEAKRIHRRKLNKDKEYKYPAFVCFYADDQKFDSTKGIWFRCANAYKILRHFEGIITPDFSTNADFPQPIKIYNTYRMRAYGYWYGQICNREVINNVRWGTSETYPYSFDGFPNDDIVCIGTVGSKLKTKEGYELFEPGFFKMIEEKSPKIILVYGSDNYPCFREAEKLGITIISFPSKTSQDFARRKKK